MAERRPGRIALVTATLERDGGLAAHVLASATALGDAAVVVSGEPGDPRRVARILGALAGEGGIVHLHDDAEPSLVEALRRRYPVVASVHGHAGCPMGTLYIGRGRPCGRAFGPGCLVSMAVRGCAHRNDPRAWVAGYRANGPRLAALAGADAVVCYSTAAQRHLERNRVARSAVVPLIAEGPARLPGWPDAPRALFVGRVVQAKGLEVLLRAMPDITCPLDVVGDGWQLPSMRRLADRLGITDRVSFHGWRDRDGVHAAYAAASVVVVPSVWPEPFGLAGADALRSGRPVVASDTGGIRDWLDDGASGLLVPPGDPVRLAAAVNALAADPARARAMGAHGAAAVARRFSAEAHVAALEDVYRRAAERWGAGRG